MKKTIFIPAIIITLMTGIIFTSYRSSAQKQEAAQTKVVYAKLDLNAAKKDTITVAQSAANAVEWKTFKSESEMKIREHEIRLAELYVKIEKQGEISDVHYKKKVAYLEQKIRYVKARLENYEKGPSNWESFKHGFNNEMDANETTLKDLTVENNN
jgi:hypothetical protein